METAEVYFRLAAQVKEREFLLEKAMLDSDVHHLEVRTGFYDKLALLAAGSLAVGVSFLASGYQNSGLKCGVQQLLPLIGIAMVLILLSLVLCIIHNAVISSAVTLLSKQVEFTYHAANTLAETAKARNSYSEILDPPPELKAKIDGYEKNALLQGTKKERAVEAAKSLGWISIALFISGYVVGITSVFMVLNRS